MPHEVSQDPLDRFLQSLHYMVDIELQMINPIFFSYISRDVAIATNFGQNWRNDLHSASWYFKTDWNIAIWISSFRVQTIPLHRVQIWRTLVQ